MASTLGAFMAVVVSTQDPAGKSRVRLRIPQLFGDTPTEWATPSSPGGLIPGVGTPVVVFFSGGDTSKPIYVSGAADTAVPFYGLRAPSNMTGGGQISVDGSFGIQWTSRFIVISNGSGVKTAVNGHFNIDFPVDGTVVTGLGTANQTVTAGRLTLTGWCALYYILPTGSIQDTVPANFRIVAYNYPIDIPANWVLIAIHNGDAPETIKFMTGVTLQAGQGASAGYGFNDSGLVRTSGDQTISGTKQFNGSEARFNFATAIRLNEPSAGSEGVIFRNDPTNFYILVTNADDQNGGWNSLRPFTIDKGTGITTMNEGVYIRGSGIGVEGANPLRLAAGATADHTYMSFYPDSQNPGTRWSWLGYGGASTPVMSVQNEAPGPNADLSLWALNGIVKANGNQVATVVDTAALTTRVGTLENNGVYNGNLIFNGDFEAWDAGNAQASGWNNFWISGSPVTAKDTSVFYQGNASWKVTVSSTSDLQRLGSPEFRVNPGDYVVIKYRMRGSALTARHDCQLLTNDASNAPDIFAPGLVSQGSASMYPGVINTWEERTVAFTVGANQTRAKVYLNFQPDAAGAHNWWLDAFSVTVPGPPPVVGSTAWIAPTLLNSWVNYGGSFAPAGYKKLGGVVHLRGLIKNGTTTGGTSLFVLPVGMRPAANESRIFATYSAAGTTRIDVGWDGIVSIQVGGSATYTSLDGISFPADA